MEPYEAPPWEGQVRVWGEGHGSVRRLFVCLFVVKTKPSAYCVLKISSFVAAV